MKHHQHIINTSSPPPHHPHHICPNDVAGTLLILIGLACCHGPMARSADGMQYGRWLYYYYYYYYLNHRRGAAMDRACGFGVGAATDQDVASHQCIGQRCDALVEFLCRIDTSGTSYWPMLLLLIATRRVSELPLCCALQGFECETHTHLPNVVSIVSRGPLEVEHRYPEITIDEACGEAVLRGADIFAV
jgi:hypothetical protein